MPVRVFDTRGALGGARPPTADLHSEAGRWESTLVLLPVGPDGAIRLFTAAGNPGAVLDVVGYYR